MTPHARAMIAACAHAIIIGRKVAGIYDHAAGRHLRIAAESRGNRLQGLDGERDARFGGTLPDIFDHGDKTAITLEIEGATARGFDRNTGNFYAANVHERQVQLFDYALNGWFAYEVQTVDPQPQPTSL